jgi:hypothetical protein
MDPLTFTHHKILSVFRSIDLIYDPVIP